MDQAATNLFPDNRPLVDYPTMVKKLFKPMNSHIEFLLHAAVGMSGEAGELLEAAFVGGEGTMLEELGDLRFYMQAIFNSAGWEMGSFTKAKRRRVQSTIEIAIAACNFQDLIKKGWVYGKELDYVQLHEAMDNIVAMYFDVLATHAMADDQVCAHNQAKLAKRYPDGVYADTDAIARADKAN